jgi:CheY-like chemotaxis protein
LPHVFDMFVQASSGPDRSRGGLGLGLTLVRHLVELHGGSVEARSAGEGKGSEFVVRLPLRSKFTGGAEAARSDDASAARGGETADQNIQPGRLNSAKRILVVEDNLDAADMLAAELEMDGYEVTVVHDGPAALSVSAEWHPDVVLLDIGLPEMDGLEVARRLRQEPGLSGLTLVALTGYGQQEDRQRTSEAGFDHHMVKPVDPETLRGVLEGITKY